MRPGQSIGRNLSPAALKLDPSRAPAATALAAVFAAACVLLAILAAAHWGMTQQRAAVAWAGETREVLRVIASLRGALVDVQNGHRGFTIEGTEEALVPYRAGVDRARREWARLALLLEHTPEQQPALAELRRLLPARFATAESLVQARRDGGVLGVRQLLASGAAAREMAGLRAVLDGMERTQEQLLASRLAQAEHDSRRLWLAFASIGALMAGAVALAYVQSRRRQAEVQRLSESEERFEMMVRGVKEYAIVFLDARGRVQTWNPGAERILGYTEQEASGGRTHVSSFYTAEESAAGSPAADLLAAAETGQRKGEGWRVRRDGSAFWASSVLSAMRHPDGALRGYCLMLRDLTERRKADEALRSEMRERARIDAELQRLNESLEAQVDTRTRELQQANGALLAAKSRLQELSARLIDAQEQERRHIARELHDETGQALTVIRMNLVNAANEENAPTHVADSIAVVDRAISQIRGMALRLRPTMLDDLGLIDALEWLLEQQARSAGWKGRFELVGDCPPLPPQVETACFRIVQEALTNAVRHARAKHVSVRVQGDAEGLRIVVEDDGVGFDRASFETPEERMKHFGLVSMSERAGLVGGTLEIDTGREQGVRITLEVPAAGDGRASEVMQLVVGSAG
jgi:PAS domain S-box-containing protein